MLEADAFGLQPFLRDYLPDGGLRSPLSMPRHPARVARAASACDGCSMLVRASRCARVGCVASAMRPTRDRFQKAGLAGSVLAGPLFFHK
jgi:hypothetical protein